VASTQHRYEVVEEERVEEIVESVGEEGEVVEEAEEVVGESYELVKAPMAKESRVEEVLLALSSKPTIYHLAFRLFQSLLDVLLSMEHVLLNLEIGLEGQRDLILRQDV